MRYEVGDKVIVHGLRDSAKHNGKTGIVAAADSVTGLYVVYLCEHDGTKKEHITVRTANLHPPEVREELDGELLLARAPLPVARRPESVLFPTMLGLVLCGAA